MAGWNLKEGNAKSTNFTDKYFFNRVNDFLSKKTSMLNLYKITIVKSLIHISSDGWISTNNDIFNQVVYEFSRIMWNFKSNPINVNTTIYNGRSYEAKQDKNIAEIKGTYKLDEKCKFEELDESVKQKYIEITKGVIKTNVIGAVFTDFNEEIYSFNLKNDELFLVKEYADFFRDYKECILQLLHYREIEFIKISEKDNEKILQYYGSELCIYGLEKNYYDLINIIIKNLTYRA